MKNIYLILFNDYIHCLMRVKFDKVAAWMESRQ